MRLLVLQHINCEPPGIYEDVLREHDIEIARIELDEGEALPPWEGFDGIVAMGGPMSAYDDQQFAWLIEEKRLISAAVRAGVPYWGVCLGAQLLASSLGASVYRGDRPEVGILKASLTAEGQCDPIFRNAPHEFATVQWHSDTFEVPRGGVLLASSDARTWHKPLDGTTAYGLQFHLEVSGVLARKRVRVPAYAESFAAMLGPNSEQRLIADIEQTASGVNSLGRSLFESWVAQLLNRRACIFRGNCISRPRGP
jgi:GMP synthase-like glutamine amidotransferase